MDFLKKNKIVSGVAVLAVFIIVAFMLYSWSSGSATSGVSETNSETDQSTQALLVTLASLNTIRLDGSIFADPVFVSLTDFGVVIPPQSAGRRNPFLPIGKAPVNTPNTAGH